IAAFGTFMVAFAALAGVLKPKMDARRAALQPPGARAGAGASDASDRARAGAAEAAWAGLPRPARGRVEDARGQPIQGAVVELHGADGTPIATTTSDATGNWSVDAVVGDPFELKVTAAGFQAARGGQHAATAAAIEFAPVALRDGGAVRLRVSGDAVGAIEGATIALLPADGAAGAEPLATATTVADGTTLLRGLDTGRYRLRAEAPDHAAAELAWRFDGVGRHGSGEVAFVLLPLVDTLHGEVRDDRHQGVDGGEVVARLVRPEPPSPETWRGEITAAGTFSIGPLPRGTYELCLQAPGLLQQGHIFAESDGEAVEIVATHGGAIHGRLTTELGQYSAPALELWRIYPDGHAQPARIAVTASVDPAAGTFVLEGVPPGRFFVRATGDGFAPCRSVPFTMAVGRPPDEVVLELDPGAALRGQLIDHRGTPSAGARITAWEGAAPPPAAWAELYPADARRAATTADDGSFALTALSSGTQVLVIAAPGQPPRTFGPIAVVAGADVELGALSIGGGAVLSLTLRSASGAAAGRSSVRVSHADGSVDLIAVADDEGNLCLRGLPAGDYTLAPGDGSEPLRTHLAEGATARHELEHSAD
ncbi:MAG: carboxypeptidase regulatory-like domain-containing protein, partial [Planctomycetes bacterium]|nr:carboxypeptidase regulatory-like domain-containing protein [Planctomycetota bacterium]